MEVYLEEFSLAVFFGDWCEQYRVGRLLGADTWAVARSVNYREQTHENQMTIRQSKIERERCDQAIHIFLLSKFLFTS